MPQTLKFLSNKREKCSIFCIMEFINILFYSYFHIHVIKTEVLKTFIQNDSGHYYHNYLLILFSKVFPNQALLNLSIERENQFMVDKRNKLTINVKKHLYRITMLLEKL